VKVPNSEFCADKGTQGAVCEFTNGGPSSRFNKIQWDQKRFGMACTEVETVTKLLGVIKKLCFDTGRCSFEEYKQLEARVMKLYRKVGRDADQAMAQLEGDLPVQ
jgi:hypothetical protein